MDPIVSRQTRSGRITLGLGAVTLVAILAMPWWAGQGLIRDMVTLCCYVAIAQMWKPARGLCGAGFRGPAGLHGGWRGI